MSQRTCRDVELDDIYQRLVDRDETMQQVLAALEQLAADVETLGANHTQLAAEFERLADDQTTATNSPRLPWTRAERPKEDWNELAD